MTFVQNTNPTFSKQPQANRVQIAIGDTQAQKTGYTAGVNGSKILGILAASTDTTNRDVQVSITNGGTSYPMWTKTVPLNSGTVAGTNPVDLMDNAGTALPYDSDGNGFLYLISGDTLTFSALATVTTGKLITIHVFAVDF